MSQSRLYRWTISPGDSDRLPAHYFTSGIVRATPLEVAAIRRDIDTAHPWLLSVEPLDGEVHSLDEFRQAVGGGLATFHGEVDGSQPCEADHVYIKAYESDWGSRGAITRSGTSDG